MRLRLNVLPRCLTTQRFLGKLDLHYTICVCMHIYTSEQQIYSVLVYYLYMLATVLHMPFGPKTTVPDPALGTLPRWWSLGKGSTDRIPTSRASPPKQEPSYKDHS